MSDLEKIKQSGVLEGSLDEFVEKHFLKLAEDFNSENCVEGTHRGERRKFAHKMAYEVNAEGLNSQVEFLLGAGYTAEHIVQEGLAWLAA